MTYNEKKSLYESIMRDVAKIVKRHLNESDNENQFEKEIEKMILKLRNTMTTYDFYEKAYIDGELNYKLIMLIERYDEYDEKVMFIAFNNNITIEKAARMIKELAEDNYYKNGTEQRFVLDFLDDLFKWAIKQ